MFSIKNNNKETGLKNYNTIFRQILNLLPKKDFDYDARVGKYNRYTKHFSVWNQLITNLYAQIRGKKSLRDIEDCLKTQKPYWYHLGLRNISKSQLSYINNKRSYLIVKNLFYHLYRQCQSHIPNHKFRFKNKLHMLDSSLIKLSLSLFPWAKYRKTKGALKIHALLDARGSIPSFITVSDGKTHDIKVAKEVNQYLSPDSIIVMDKAYIDYKWLYQLHQRGVYFVVRAKRNMDYEVIGQHKPVKNKYITEDIIIRLFNEKSYDKYPNSMRMISYWDEESDEEYTYITNNLSLAASTIAKIYKARWDIEIFFKWIKQNLKIKHFMGTSENAVMTQVWTAMIYYLLLSYIKFQTKYVPNILKLARIIGETLFQRVDIIDILNLNLTNILSGRDPCQQRILINI